MNMRKRFARIVAGIMLLGLAGCDDTKRHAESIGVIGGADAPTAVWLSSWSAWSLNFLDCLVPVVSIAPQSTIEDARDYLEKVVLNPPGMNGIDGLGPIKVELVYGRNLVVPLKEFYATNVPVRTVLTEIAERDRAKVAWNPKRRVVSFLCKGKLNQDEWRKILEDAGEIIYPSNPDNETPTERSNP